MFGFLTLLVCPQTLLSALSLKLQKYSELKLEVQSHLINVFVSAYPDLRPWQVQRGLLIGYENLANDDGILAEFYYNYLSHLLHPHHGHDSARSNGTLVKEWCRLSISAGSDNAYNRSRRENFVVVASRRSNEYRLFKRDLLYMFDLAIEAKEFDLVLEISEYCRTAMVCKKTS